MEENTVFTRRYDPSSEKIGPVRLREVWRYAGFPGGPGGEEKELLALMDRVTGQSEGIFRYAVCYRHCSLSWADDMPLLPFPSASKNLADCLRGSREIYMMAATIGIGIDRKIAAAQHTDPAAALLWQALGAERAEALCDAFCGEIREELAARGLVPTPRFSPGYGDLPLEAQPDFIRLLDTGRQIGVTLGEGLLMSPSKSVTAIFGARPPKEKEACGQAPDAAGCAACGAVSCSFRIQEEKQ